MIPKIYRLISLVTALSVLGGPRIPAAFAASNECADDPRFRFKKDEAKDCNWVGRVAKRRCNRKWKGEKIHTYCPGVCNKCPDADPDGNNDNNNNSCKDDPRFRFNNEKKKNCNWVGLKPKKRCSREWKGIELGAFCPEMCNTCDEITTTPAKCEDDETLEYRENPNRSCGWVSKRKKVRCKKTWKGTQLKDLCPVTCDACSDESNDDDNDTGGGNGCCSLDYKQCIGWCGPTKDSCKSCNHHDGVGWLENGAPTGQCKRRWRGCENTPNACCPGLTCREDDNNWLMCQPLETAASDPTGAPTNLSPTASPTEPPTGAPSPFSPTNSPTGSPTGSPSFVPTTKPTTAPTIVSPTAFPTEPPSGAPSTLSPTTVPTGSPTGSPPTGSPSFVPTTKPTAAPTIVSPNAFPTMPPTGTPSASSPTNIPTGSTTGSPSFVPSTKPTIAPTIVSTTVSPTMEPTVAPSASLPTKSPTGSSTGSPSFVPTTKLTTAPTIVSPTVSPTKSPTVAPSASLPTKSPTGLPTPDDEVDKDDNITAPCCSLDYKTCIDWCGSDYDSCATCNHHDGVFWLEDGPPQDEQCLDRWTGCENDTDACCDGLTCRVDNNNWLMCLPLDPPFTASPTGAPAETDQHPTASPTASSYPSSAPSVYSVAV